MEWSVVVFFSVFFSLFARCCTSPIYFGASGRCGTDRRAGPVGQEQDLERGQVRAKICKQQRKSQTTTTDRYKKRKRNKSLWMNPSSICSRPFRPAVRSRKRRGGGSINTATTQLYDMCVAATKFGFFFLSFSQTGLFVCCLF